MLLLALAVSLAQLPFEPHSNLNRAPASIGSVSRVLGSLPDAGTLVIVNHPSTGNELWLVTSSGATFLKDVCPGVASAAYGDPVTLADRTYFAADDCRTGLRLWVTDGTGQGTRPALDAGLTSSSLIVAGSTLFMLQSPNRLASWGGLGTPPREVTLADGGPVTAGPGAVQLLSNQEVVFINGAGEFWRSDGGTAARLASPAGNLKEWAMAGSSLLQVGASGQPQPSGICPPFLTIETPYVVDTRAASPALALVASDAGYVGFSRCIPPPPTFVLETLSYFVAGNSSVGVNGAAYLNLTLWPAPFLNTYSPGGSTTQVIGPRSNVAGAVTGAGGGSSFIRGSPTLGFAVGSTLLALDGTATSVSTGVGGGALQAQVISGDRALIGHGLGPGRGIEVWSRTGGPATRLASGPEDSTGLFGPYTPASSTAFGFHTALDAGGISTGLEPWWTNGTAAGTFAISNLRTDEGASSPANLVSAAGAVYFAASPVPGIVELHRAGRDAGSAARVVDLNSTDSGTVTVIGASGGTVYFTGRDPNDVLMAWSGSTASLIDGAPAGQLAAFLVGDELVYTRGPTLELTWLRADGGQRLRALTAARPTRQPATLGDRLFTPINNRLLELQLPGQPQVLGSSRNIAVAQNTERVFAFISDGGVAIDVYSASSAGTPFTRFASAGAATTNVIEIISPAPVATRDSLWYLLRTSGTTCELRRLDLVSAQSTVVPGGWESLDCFAPLARIGGEVWLSAWTNDAGLEPWRVHPNGTTELLADVVPGALGAGLSEFARIGDTVVFSGLDRGGDRELYRATLGDTTPPVVQPSVTGTMGLAGWYTSSPTVSFAVSDAESEAVVIDGCRSSTLQADGVSPPLTCTADSLGGSTTVSVVLKRDATAPFITCPAALTVDATSPAGAQVSLQAADAGDLLTAVTVTASPAGPSYAIGVNEVTLRAADEAGNTADCTVAVTVIDRPPLIACPGGTSREASSPEGALLPLPAVTVTDVVSPDAVGRVIDGGRDLGDGGVLVALGAHLLEVQVTDLSGNTASCTVPVEVTDRTAPALTCPDLDVTAEVPDAGTVTVEFTGVQAFDAVSTLTPTFEPASGTAFMLGDTQVTGTATDEAGNTGSCTFNVHVTPCTGKCGKTVQRSLYRWSCQGCSTGPEPLVLALAALLWRARKKRRQAT